MTKNKKKLSRARKYRNNKLIYILLFLAGLFIMSYPFISQYYYKYEAQEEILQFDKEKYKLQNDEINKRIELAKLYNRTLDPTRISDPYTEEEKLGIAEYAKMLELNEKIGYVDIPTINEKIPIYAGTNEDVLQKGAGHLEGTSLPIGGESTHTVITAHRGLPNAKLFTNLDKLKEGDIFYIHNISSVLAYKVDKITIVEPNQFEEILVVPDKDYATLLTCTPYMVNSHRLLVRGYSVPYIEKTSENNLSWLDRQMIEYAVVIIILVIILILIKYYFNRKNKRKYYE